MTPLLLATVVGFTGVEAPRWNWRAAAAVYSATIAADYALTERCLAAGTCVEGNSRAQTSGDRLKLSGLAFGAMMAGDRLAFEAHPRAPWILRFGFVLHRGLAQMRVDVTW